VRFKTVTDVKLIVYMGNSLTFGFGVRDKTKIWAHILAESLGLDYINLSSSSKGNRWMVRKAYSALDLILKKRGLREEEILVLTMWGACDFYEFYRRDRWEHMRPWDGQPQPKTGEVSKRLKRIDIRAQVKLFYKTFYHSEGATIDTMVDWIGYESWLKGRGFRYGFILGLEEVIMTGPSQMKSERTKTALEAYFGMVDKSKILGGEIDPEKSMIYVNLLKEFPILKAPGEIVGEVPKILPGELRKKPRRHPLESGQRHFSDAYLLPWAKKLISEEDQNNV